MARNYSAKRHGGLAKPKFECYCNSNNLLEENRKTL